MDAVRSQNSVTNAYHITIAESAGRKKRRAMWLDLCTGRVMHIYIYIWQFTAGQSAVVAKAGVRVNVHSLVAGCILLGESAFCCKFPCHLAALRSTSDHARYDRSKQQRHSLAPHHYCAIAIFCFTRACRFLLKHLFHPPLHRAVSLTVREPACRAESGMHRALVDRRSQATRARTFCHGWRTTATTAARVRNSPPLLRHRGGSCAK